MGPDGVKAVLPIEGECFCVFLPHTQPNKCLSPLYGSGNGMFHQAPSQAHPLKFLSHIDPLDLQGIGVVEIRLGRGLVQLQIACQCFAAVQEVKRGICVLQLPP